VHLWTNFESRTRLYGQHSVKSHRLGAVTRIDLPRHESPRGQRAPRSRRSKGEEVTVRRSGVGRREVGGGGGPRQAICFRPMCMTHAMHAADMHTIPFRSRSRSLTWAPASKRDWIGVHFLPDKQICHRVSFPVYAQVVMCPCVALCLVSLSVSFSFLLSSFFLVDFGSNSRFVFHHRSDPGNSEKKMSPGASPQWQLTKRRPNSFS